MQREPKEKEGNNAMVTELVVMVTEVVVMLFLE